MGYFLKKISRVDIICWITDLYWPLCTFTTETCVFHMTTCWPPRPPSALTWNCSELGGRTPDPNMSGFKVVYRDILQGCDILYDPYRDINMEYFGYDRDRQTFNIWKNTQIYSDVVHMLGNVQQKTSICSTQLDSYSSNVMGTQKSWSNDRAIIQKTEKTHQPEKWHNKPSKNSSTEQNLGKIVPQNHSLPMSKPGHGVLPIGTSPDDALELFSASTAWHAPRWMRPWVKEKCHF